MGLSWPTRHRWGKTIMIILAPLWENVERREATRDKLTHSAFIADVKRYSQKKKRMKWRCLKIRFVFMLITYRDVWSLRAWVSKSGETIAKVPCLGFESFENAQQNSRKSLKMHKHAEEVKKMETRKHTTNVKQQMNIGQIGRQKLKLEAR